jgi:hypothetical protein
MDIDRSQKQIFNKLTVLEEDFKFDGNPFCLTQKVTPKMFSFTWALITQQFEYNFTVQNLFSTKEASIIRRLQANNYIVTSFRLDDTCTILYLSACTRDNIRILAEMTLSSISICSKAKIKYRCETLCKEIDFEDFLRKILTSKHENYFDPMEAICR